MTHHSRTSVSKGTFSSQVASSSDRTRRLVGILKLFDKKLKHFLQYK